MGKRDKNTTDDASFQAATPPTSASSRALLGPLEIQQKEFRVSRFGGYKMRDVDEFLDTVTDSMSALVAENDRLRKGGAPAPVVGSPDLEDVSRQADEIIQRARTEAARIVAEAKLSQPQQGATAATPQDRVAVNAFLAKEREFLQSLAGLVQGHAESVKGMSKAVRKPAATPPPATPPTPATPKTEATPQTTAVHEPVEPAAEGPTKVPESDAAVRVAEPEPASVARSDGDDGGGVDGDRSLRDLFWGED